MNFLRWALVAWLGALWLAGAADWAQWGGPSRDGHVPPGVAIPAQLPAEPKIVWRTHVTEGLASPIVYHGKVFYLDNQQGKETIHEINAADAAPLWTAILDDVPKDSQSPPGPRCTPLADGERLFAQSSRGELQCLDVADGKVLWEKNYPRDFGAVFIGEKGTAAGASRHGYNGQPLIDGDHLIALAGGSPGAGVICLNKTNGETVWKSQDDPAAYSPPVIAVVAGRRQALAFTVNGLIGLDPADGKLLWRVPLKTTYGRHVTTPVTADDMVMVASHEIGLVGVKVTSAADGLRAEQAWLNKDAAINFSSPVVVGSYLYGLGPAKNLICVDAHTGKIAWSKDGYFTSAAGKAHAGMLVMGKNILILTDDGQLALIAADPAECREISRLQVCGFNWCNPAYADGRLYLRDSRDLICVELLK